MIPKTFGLILRGLRIEAGLSQEKLGELADYDRTYISLLERGLRQPTITTIFDLSKALNIKPSYIISLTEKKVIGIE